MENHTLHSVPEDLVSPREAAKILKLHLASVYRMIADGRLPAWRRGGMRFFVSRAAVLGVFLPPGNIPSQGPASHQEAVEKLRRLGWM
jgi:excisionase family DNA binding protein